MERYQEKQAGLLKDVDWPAAAMVVVMLIFLGVWLVWLFG